MANRDVTIQDKITHDNCYPITRATNVIMNNNTNVETVLSETSTRSVANTNNISQLSNPNLLINSDFRINQRGQSSYNNTNAGHNKYTVDRWVHYNNYDYTLTQNTGYGITLSATGTNAIDIAQLIEDGYNMFNGKTLTASAKVDNVIYAVSLLIATNTLNNVKFYQSEVESGSLYLECTSANKLKVWFRARSGKTINVSWVKLELGSITTPFSPRPYAEELAMCQRYYQILKGGANGIGISGTFIAASTTAGYAYINLVNLRTIPTLMYSNLNDIKLGYSTSTFNSITVSSIQYNEISKDYSSYKAYVTGTGLTSGQCYFLGIDVDGYIALDAEIY